MTEAIKTIYNNITKTIDMVVYPKLAVNSSKYDDIVVALRNEMGKINVNY